MVPVQNMQKQFEKLLKKIKLTKAQREDARVKCRGVCKKIHEHFYTEEYNGSTKLIFGSYAKAKRTAIRPFSEDQDVDVLFKIPKETFDQYDAHQGNGQSELLQKIRDILLASKYALGEKPSAWGKVILVKTADGTHNIEVLPAYELEDGGFKIPNSEAGGSWEDFDPRANLENFRLSNLATGGLTGHLSRMVKRWALTVSSLSLKSFQIENFVIAFLEAYDFSDKKYSQIVADFFAYLLESVDEDNRSLVETAKNRSAKALSFEVEEKFEKATEEWRKIFGTSFPSRSSVYKNAADDIAAPEEEFIENRVPVRINSQYQLRIDCEVVQDGFRPTFLSSLRILRKQKRLEFFIAQHNIPEPFSVYWKVRNFGAEAEEQEQLRGKITLDEGRRRKKEGTRYEGEHFVECYIVKNGFCVQRAHIMVPIGSI